MHEDFLYPSVESDRSIGDKLTVQSIAYKLSAVSGKCDKLCQVCLYPDTFPDLFNNISSEELIAFENLLCKINAELDGYLRRAGTDADICHSLGGTWTLSSNSRDFFDYADGSDDVYNGYGTPQQDS